MIEIKGRTPFSESNKYLRQVRDRSTTRGLTVALATPSTGQDFRNAHSMQRASKEKERAGLDQGPRRRRTVGVRTCVPDHRNWRTGFSGEFAGAGARAKDARQGRHHALGRMVHPKEAAGARAGARAEARVRALAADADPDASRPPPPSTFTPGVYSDVGAEGPGRARRRPCPAARRFRLPRVRRRCPRPRRDAAASSSRSSAPHRVRHRHPRRRRCLPAPRRRRAPAPPRARRAARPPPPARRRPSPATAGYGPAPEHDRAVVPQRAAGPPPPVSGSGGPGVPGRPPSPRDRGREWERERGGWRRGSVATSRRLTVETGRRMTRGVPVPVPVLPGRSEPFRAGDGWGRDRWPPGGPDRDRGGLAGSGSGPGSAGRQTRAGQRGAPGRSRASGTVRQREGERRRSRWRMEYRGARPVRMAGQRETPGPAVLIPVGDARPAREPREDVHRVKMSFHFGFAATPGEKRRRFSPRAARFPDAPRPLSPDARSTSNRARRSIVRPRPAPSTR